MRSLAFCVLVLVISAASRTASQQTGRARSERYWDCCKPDCAWEAKAAFNQPAAICGRNNEPFSDPRAASSCGIGGGNAFACADQSPWAVNDTFSYGFAGVFITQHASDYWCCACYEISWSSGDLQGKRMVVQANNAGFDITTLNRFMLAVPGGNTSFAHACATQYGVDNSVFGVENRGVRSRDDCENLPEPLRPGCYWRFDWYLDQIVGEVDYRRVTCPAVLTNITGCVRDDDTTFSSAVSPIAIVPSYQILIAVGLVMLLS